MRPPDCCDFCYTLVPLTGWTYQTSQGRRLIEMPGDLPDYSDDGLWAACPECKAVIDTGDTDALIKRSVRAQGVEISARDLVWKTELLTYFMENRGEAFLPGRVRDGQHRS